jgi:hypothetical protein
MEARKEHDEAVKSNEYVNPHVKSVANAHSVMAHSNDGSYPKHINRPSKKQRSRKKDITCCKTDRLPRFSIPQ